MTTIRQLIQTSPTKANELFAKLVDSSTTAVKTRERLFAELKNELGLLASLEEQHLFPVLKKHRETKKLAIEAQSDNRQARRLLADLERTPKGSEDFAAKVSDLRKAFQQHVRDEKNELLPAILKALSDEETEAVVEKIEDKKAEVQAIRRLETEERRAETRRERDVVEAAEQTAESAANVVRAGSRRRPGDGLHGSARVSERRRDGFRCGPALDEPIHGAIRTRRAANAEAPRGGHDIIRRHDRHHHGSGSRVRARLA